MDIEKIKKITEEVASQKLSDEELAKAELPVGDTETESISKFTSGLNYEKSEEIYKENLSSAITFFVCGIIGVTLLLLNDFGVISFFSRSGVMFILINLVFGVMFAIFLGVAVYSLKRANKAKANISNEKSINNEISDWLKENIIPEAVDASFNSEGMAEEMKYFDRVFYIRKALVKEFPDAPHDLVDALIDEYIEETFNK